MPLQETSQNVGASQNQTGSMSSELSGSLSSLSDERRSSLTEVRTRRSGSSESTDSDSYKSRDRKIGEDTIKKNKKIGNLKKCCNVNFSVSYPD